MKNNIGNRTLKNIFKSKSVKAILCVCICWFVFSAFVVGSWDNSTPSKAIAKYLYNENPSWTTFFVNVKEELSYNKDELHYRVEFNGLIPTPENTSGVFKLVKENNRYRVIEYNGNHG